MATTKQTSTGTETTQADADTRTVNLRQPIMVDGVQTQTLVMHPVSVGDQIDARERGGENNALVECDLIARSCHIAPDAVRQVDARDYARLQDGLMYFLGAGPGNSSAGQRSSS